MVKIFFYTSAPSKFGREITCTLALSVENAFQFHSVYSQAKLKQMLQDEVDAAPIIIIAAQSHQELDELLPLRNIHRDMPVVLLLPDDAEETLYKAHKFRPKFLTTVDHDFSYVLAVVEKLGESLCDQHSVAQVPMA